MLRNITQFKSVVDTFESTFNFDVNTPIPVAKQQIFDCLKWIGSVEESIEKNKKEEPEATTEEALNEQPIT